MSTKKLSARKIIEFKKTVMELMKTGVNQKVALANVAETLNITYNQAYYRYFKASTRPSQKSYEKDRASLSVVNMSNSTLRFSMNLIENVSVSDNELVINFRVK